MDRKRPVRNKTQPIRFPHYHKNNIRVLNVDGSIAIVSIDVPKDKYPLDLITYYDYIAIDELHDIDDIKYFILNSFLTNQIKHIMFVYESNKYVNDIIDFFNDDDIKYGVYSYDLLDNFDVVQRINVNESKSPLYKHIREQLINDFQFDIYQRFGLALDETIKAKQPIIDKMLDDFIRKFKDSYTLVSYIEFINRYYRMSKSANKSTHDVVRRFYRCKDVIDPVT